MATEIRLAAQPRDTQRSVNALRRDGFVPGVVYGHGFATKGIQFSATGLSRLLNTAGSAHIIQLDLGGETHMTLVRDIQRDPVTAALLHVDLYRVVATEKITSQVRVVHRGRAPALDLGGSLSQFVEVIEIECLPADLPDTIEVSVESLASFHAAITVGDLPIPAGVAVLTPADTEVFRVTPPRVSREEEEKPAEATEAATAAAATPAAAAPAAAPAARGGKSRGG